MPATRVLWIQAVSLLFLIALVAGADTAGTNTTATTTAGASGTTATATTSATTMSSTATAVAKALRLGLQECSTIPSDPCGISKVPFFYGPGWILGWFFLVANTLLQIFYTNERLMPDALLVPAYPIIASGDVLLQVLITMQGISMEQAKTHYAHLAVLLFILTANWNFVGVWSAGYMVVKLICPDYLPEHIYRLARWPAIFVYGQVIVNAVVTLGTAVVAWVFWNFDGLKVREMEIFGYMPQMAVWIFGVCLVLLFTPMFAEESVFRGQGGRGTLEDEEYGEEEDEEPTLRRLSLVRTILGTVVRVVRVLMFFVIYIFSWLSSAITFCAPVLFFLCLPFLLPAYTTSPFFTLSQLIPAGLGFALLAYRLQTLGFWIWAIVKVLMMLGRICSALGWNWWRGRYERVEMREIS